MTIKTKTPPRIPFSNHAAPLPTAGNVILVAMEMCANAVVLLSTKPKRPLNPPEIARERQRVIIADELRIMVAEAGGPVVDVEVTDGYGRWRIGMLQWAQNGAGVHRTHDLQLWDLDMPETKVRRTVRGRFSRLIETQRELAAGRGPARILSPGEVDLSDLRIEAPVAAALEAVYGRVAGPRLRAMIAGDQTRAAYAGPSRPSDKDAGISDLEAEAGRRVVKGSFTLTAGETTLEWSKGGLNIFGLALPQAMLFGCAGRRLGDLFQHPVFDPDIAITAVAGVHRRGVEGIALTTKNFMRDLPEAW